MSKAAIKSIEELGVNFPEVIQDDYGAGQLYYAAENSVGSIRDGRMSVEALDSVRAGMEAYGDAGAGYMSVIDEAYSSRADWAQVGGGADRSMEGAFLDRLAENRDAHMETFMVVRDEARLQALVDGLNNNKFLEDDKAYVRIAAYGRVGFALEALESNMAGAVSGVYGDLCTVAIDVDRLSDGLGELKDELQALADHVDGYRAARVEAGVECEAVPKL